MAFTDDEKYGIGTATQFPILDIEGAPIFSRSGTPQSGLDIFEQAALAKYADQYNPYGETSDWGQDVLSNYPKTQESEQVASAGGGNWLNKLINTAKTAGGKALDFAGTDRGLMAILAALASYADRQRPSGGGVGTAYAGYKPLQRTMQGNIARYAAQGGIMHAYAQGGAVRPFPMQDGGFVLTKRAVDGAGGPEEMRQYVPEAVPIRGPGHGTSDSIPAYIQGPHGRTPAKVSNGEMYVPPGRDTRGLYALMRAMERKA